MKGFKSTFGLVRGVRPNPSRNSDQDLIFNDQIISPSPTSPSNINSISVNDFKDMSDVIQKQNNNIKGIFDKLVEKTEACRDVKLQSVTTKGSSAIEGVTDVDIIGSFNDMNPDKSRQLTTKFKEITDSFHDYSDYSQVSREIIHNVMDHYSHIDINSYNSIISSLNDIVSGCGDIVTKHHTVMNLLGYAYPIDPKISCDFGNYAMIVLELSQPKLVIASTPSNFITFNEIIITIWNNWAVNIIEVASSPYFLSLTIGTGLGMTGLVLSSVYAVSHSIPLSSTPYIILTKLFKNGK